MKKPKPEGTQSYTYAEAIPKAMRYCAYQERSSRQVRDKLYEWGLEEAEVERAVLYLQEEKFIDDRRFALAYAGGKFRLKSWGRHKIRQGLLPHRLPEELVKEALRSIDGDAYYARLQQLMERKDKSLTEKDSRIRQQKLLRYGLSKGFEQDLVWEALKEIRQ
jgi:regulatory protein